MSTTALPNIIIMYADDLGFGDIGCYGATRIPTPHLDDLAATGLLFEQGYSTAATCTPSRYSLLTGSYPWRNPKAAILPGDAAMIIDESTPTLATMLRNAGYATGVVGKWHLGLGHGSLDWNRSIPRTPNDVGFDYSCIMAATNDRVPCVYIENREVVGGDWHDPIEVTYDDSRAFKDIPTGRSHPDQLTMRFSHGHDGTIVNGVSRIGHMRGGKKALWQDETMADYFAAKAADFVRQNCGRPFFLYYAFHQPHVPRIPGPRFRGRTGLGPRGDVIAEMDDCAGRLINLLDQLGIRENTMVIFSSDNGPVLDDGYCDQAVELNGKHQAAGPLRGGKYSLFDGGTHVPLIINQPGTIRAGVSSALISHVDFYASFAALAGPKLAPGAAPDSLDLSDVIMGLTEHGRDELVLEGIHGKLLLRNHAWVYIPPYKGAARDLHTNIELGNAASPQLYNLNADIGQIRNLAEFEPIVLDTMATRLRQIIAAG